LIYSSENVNSGSLSSNSKNIRNNYLKKLVEANEEYYPAELKQEKLKKNAPVSYEEKFYFKNQLPFDKGNNNNTKEKSKGKENKNLNKKRERDEDLSFSGNAKKTNISDKLNNENDDLKNGNNKKINNNNNLDKNKKSKIIVDDDQSEKEESQEDQSFDEYLMESEENMSDYGSDNDERDYSDGGVF